MEPLTALWQLWPAYAAVALLLLARRAPRRPLRLVAHALVVLLLVLSAALVALFPIFRLPAPTGPHAVGTTYLAFVDDTRAEIFSDDPADRRALAVQAWYPAQPSDAPRARYAQDGRALGRQLTAALKFPAFLLDHLALVREHARVDAPPAPGPWPVVLFSHGYAQGFVGQNTTQMQELASHGYFVASIGRPYESALTIYPDGRRVGPNQAHLARVRERLAGPQSAWANAPPAERDARFRALAADTRAWAESVDIWAQDIRFVLDALARVNGERFGGRLDVSRVGALGMSFGGVATARACLLEPRLRAGANLDGVQLGDVLGHPIAQPFLFMYSGTPAAQQMNHLIYEEAAGPAYQVTVAGSTHFNFTDLSLWSPLFRRLGLLGPIDGHRMVHVVNAHLLAFFERHLRGRDAAVPALPEATVESRNVNR